MKRRPARAQLCVITPVFNEEESLPLYFEALDEVLFSEPGLAVQVLLVDDGSSDRSWSLIEERCVADERLLGLRLSRNVGSHRAIAAGFEHVPAGADAVAILACDQQDPPEVIREFVARWREGADIVWGERRTRQDSRWKQAASSVFARAVGRWAMPAGSKFTTGSFLLADAKVVEAVRCMPERSRVTFALVGFTGFDQVRVPYDRRERVAGSTGWTFGGMLAAMFDTFVGFSRLPIRFMVAAAGVTAVLASVLGLYLVFVAVVGDPVPGWTSQMLLISLFFAIQFTLGSISGEYLYRIHRESVARPLYFVADSTDEPQADRPIWS